MSIKLKLILYIALIIIIFVITNETFFTAALVLTTAVFILHRNKKIRAGWLPITFILIPTFIGNILFTDGKIVLDLGWIYISKEGVYLAIIRTSRVFIMIVGLKLLMLNTKPEDFVKSAAELLNPLKRIFKIPVDDFLELIVFTIYAFPMLKDQLIENYKEKVKETEIKSTKERLSIAISLITPVINAILTSPEIYFKEILKKKEIEKPL
ncbi:ABC transporter cobalt-specific permease [Candidatus Magnetoovum chiemensis]|nr:ABC transporter cobalt-specific permease [Candidatus Magnetoovum chiemensis]